MAEILFEMVAELRGDYPTIPLPEDIDREALGPNVMFVTLPLMPKGARGNGGTGRLYTDSIVESIATQINAKRPEGQWGHVPLSELSSTYNPPALRCLSAQFHTDGKLWGKFLPMTDAAREHFRIAKATNAKVATSIFGDPIMKDGQFIGVDLHKIDIADPSRAGIGGAVAVPVITAEMQEKGEPVMTEQIAEITGQRDQLQEQVTTLAARVTELSAHSGIVAELRSMFGADANIVAEVTNLRGQVAEMAAAKTKHDIDALIDTLVPVAELRDTVREIAGGAATVDAAKSKIDAYMATPGYTRLAQALVSEQAGGAALVGAGITRDREAALDKAVEAGKKKADQLSGHAS